MQSTSSSLSESFRLLIVFTTLSTDAPVMLYFSMRFSISEFSDSGRFRGLSFKEVMERSCSLDIASNL